MGPCAAAFRHGEVLRGCCTFVGLLLLACLGACGGGGGGGGAAQPDVRTADYFPLAVGDRWSYTEGLDALQVRVSESLNLDGRPGRVIQLMRNGQLEAEQVYVSTSTGIAYVPGTDLIEQALGEVTVLRLPVVSGESYVSVDRTLNNLVDADGDGRFDVLAVRAEVTVIGFETLTTGSGSFTDVAHVRTRITQTLTLARTGQVFTANGTVDDWYAPQVGPVRSVTTWTGTVADGTTEQAIVAYKVGALRSESTPPRVAELHPAAGSVGSNDFIRVVFDEPLDAFGDLSQALSLSSAGGQAVPGTWSRLDDRTLRFQPFVSLQGDYSVAVNGVVEDRASNVAQVGPLGSFTIDRIGPSVVEMLPAPDSIEVPLDSVIQLSFDEVPIPASVQPSSFSLFDLLSARQVAFTVTLTDRTVTITPTAPFERGKTYRVAVDPGLIDALGNRGPMFVADFKADPGRFAAPRPVSGVGVVFGIEMADFNGDGRADLALSANPQFGGPIELYLATQQADGSLAEAQRVAASTSCQPSGLSAGDFDSDGLSDLVTGGFCGVQVLRQTVEHTLVSAAELNVAAFHVRWVPIVADGRLGIVGTDQNGALNVWRQSSPGVFSASAPLPIPIGFATDVAIADFNGDGRVDVAVSGSLLPVGSGIVVLHQQADGGFSVAQQMPVDLVWGASSVAAGDVNGDGRIDLVFSTGGNSPTVIGLVLQRADGSFAPYATLPTYDSPAAIRVADVNADGRADVVVTHFGWSAVGVYLQGADGKLTDEQRFESSYGQVGGQGLGIGDINNDGLVDIVSFESVLLQRRLPTSAAANTGAPAQGRPLKTLRWPRPATTPGTR